ncbi:CYTH domain-containing protein [Stutzerimonas tarimensis]|uniref:Inorganic triphosphatase n=1 Tax=Stutzerimonas tarimensis TaxID=1507735 RepID=A0ABV7T7S4_9GAMM
MHKETEIKLRASRDTLSALRQHPLLKKRSKSGWQRHELFNQYYDTPDRELSAACVALRLRRDGETSIQTLKSRGQSVAGLSERNEWDWYLERPELDLSKLDDSCWPAALATLDKNRLAPIFRTDFVREKADIAWGRGKARVVIEAALDLGRVVSGDSEEEICELELELRQGEPVALLELAIELAADLPLMPCDISKAERGYRLHDPAGYRLRPAPVAPGPGDSLDRVFATLAWQLLGTSQRLAEQYRFNGHWTLLVDWLQQLIDLRALLASLGSAAPRASSRALREGLDALILEWRPIVVAGQGDDAIRQSAPQRFAGELEQPRWGLLSLQIAHWLLTRGWTIGRNARGDRQGEAVIGKWLPRTLAEEAQALRLDRYGHQPEQLQSEQLPRLERMLVWLRLARSTLVLSEADRLFGELAKLHALAEQGVQFEALAEQARTLWTLKAFRELMK